jgi:RNA polymerase sigma-70 factor (ECF subfamily)
MLREHPAAGGEETAVFDLEYRREVFLWAAAKVRETVTPTTWQAFWQTSVEARPIAGVAQSLGISVGSAYIARSRVMAKLRDQASQYCAAPEAAR